MQRTGLDLPQAEYAGKRPPFSIQSNYRFPFFETLAKERGDASGSTLLCWSRSTVFNHYITKQNVRGVFLSKAGTLSWTALRVMSPFDSTGKSSGFGRKRYDLCIRSDTGGLGSCSGASDYSTAMALVGRFSSLLVNRTSRTPFLYVAFAVLGSTRCGSSSSLK